MNSNIYKIINEVREVAFLENKSLAERIVKFNEEFGEFSAEIIKHLGLSQKPYDREHLKEECSDVQQVLLSIFVLLEKECGITIDEIFDNISVKNKKWRDNLPFYTNLNK